MTFVLYLVGIILLVTGFSVLFEGQIGMTGPVVEKFEYPGRAVIHVLFGHGKTDRYAWLKRAVGIFIIIGGIGCIYSGWLWMFM